MNRAGNIMDGFGILTTIFTIGILCYVGVLFINGFNDGIQASPNLPSAATNISSGVDSDIGWVLDFFILMMFLSMPIVSMLLAFFNNIHPLFFWASLGVTMLLVIVGSAFQDSFVNLISGSTFGGVSAQMPWSTILFSHFGMYALFVVLVIAAGVFVKARSALGYGQ